MARWELSGDDLLYGDEIVGYDDDMVGAAPAPAKRLSGMPGYPQGQQLRTVAPTRAREYVMGIDSVATIAAAATLSISSRPQVIFRPDRLVVPSTIAGSFLINDLRVGKNSQFVNATAVPAEAFTQGAVGVRLKMDTTQISQDIVVSVTNISAGALRFNAALIGPSVE